MSAALLELAERCEKAQGPDREIDAAICLALHPEWAAFPRDDREGQVGWQHPEHGRIYLNTEYTTSRGAALTLVPDGWEWTVSNYIDGVLGTAAPYAHRNPTIVVEAATPALALCAAALRARAAS